MIKSSLRTSLAGCLVIFTTIIMAIIAVPATAQISDSTAMNESGRQRMLSQRMAKAWLMIGMDINTEKAYQELDESVARFEKNYLDLQEYASTPQVQNALNEVGQIWQQYRTIILSTPDIQQAAHVIKSSDQLLKSSEQVVREIEAHSGLKAAKLVNISGRQRMLSQRIAKLYMAQSWNVKYDAMGDDMQTAIDEFEAALSTLQNAPINTPSIHSQLKKVNSQWRFSKTGFQLDKNGQHVPTVISVTTESILKKMDQLTHEYVTAMSQHTSSQ